MLPAAVLLLAATAAAAAASLPGALTLASSCTVQTAQLALTAPAARAAPADVWLGMYCNNRDLANFAYNWTWIGLDACLSNRGGHLHGRRNGHFGATCTRCAVHVAATAGPAAQFADHTLKLQCACRDPRGRGVSTVIDLNNVLYNVDGALGCYGHLGNKTLVGPLPKS